MTKRIGLAIMFAACIAHAGKVQITDMDTSEVVDVVGGAIAMTVSGTQDVAVVSVPTVAQLPFYQAVSMGLVEGYGKVNKFGHNPAATDGDTVWGGGGAYAFFPTNAQAVSVVSSDADDAEGDTGARTATFYGLDANWEEASETVTLNGQTPVALTNTYIRMFRGIVLTAGGSYSNEGNLSVTNGAGTVAIYINAGDGQTQHAVYTVPANTTAYFLRGYVGLADDDKNGEIAEFQWQARPNNGHTGAWAVKGEIGLNNVGSGHWQYEYGCPSGPIPAKTDIRIVTINTTATLGVVGGFDMLLVDD